MTSFVTEYCPVQSITLFNKSVPAVDVLRLDLIHPVISGNKWFKLKNYLAEAKKLHKKIILTFGGAYSNHIVATAAAAAMNGFKSIGIIRGEAPSQRSKTLLDAEAFGMKLIFISREDYKRKQLPALLFTHAEEKDLYTIPEGGYGLSGAEGASLITAAMGDKSYTHIMAPVGTGTTLAGLTLGARPHQQVIGVSAMKGNTELQSAVAQLLPDEKKQQFSLLHQYHFGGYAKYNDALLTFMNHLFTTTGIPTDFVYTAKTFFAAYDLLQQGVLSARDKLLIIHTGGLQGNRSLSKGTLIFGT